MIEAKTDQIFKRPDALIGAIKRAGLLHLRETLQTCNDDSMCVLLLALAEHASVLGGCGLLRCRRGKSVLCLPASVLKSKSVLGQLGIPPSPRKSLTVKHDVISCNKIPSPLFLDKACHLLSHNFELNTLRARD